MADVGITTTLAESPCEAPRASACIFCAAPISLKSEDGGGQTCPRCHHAQAWQLRYPAPAPSRRPEEGDLEESPDEPGVEAQGAGDDREETVLEALIQLIELTRSREEPHA